jgi:hypothetical protein
MCVSRTKSIWAVVLTLVVSASLFSAGPVDLDGESAVSIYRDFDDGLYGRSLYRGVVFSVKLGSFDRYRSLPSAPAEGLTAYLVSAGRALGISRGEIEGITREGIVPGSAGRMTVPDIEKWIYAYEKDGLEISFALEKAPGDLLAEIRRTYPENEETALLVSSSYRDGFVVRVYRAENVYRPEHSELDYEDVLIAASFAGDRFQPLWGIHDGNALTVSGN